MKKLSTLFFAVIGICIGINAYAATVTDVGITMYEVLTPSQNFVIDDIPKATLRYNLADDSADMYHVCLTVNDSEKQIIKLPTTGGKLKEYSFNYPITQEGIYNLQIDVMENGAVKYTNTYSISYVQSIRTGYTQRGFNTHFGHNTHKGNDAALMKAMGADVYRDTIYWSSVERYIGKYDFSAYDVQYASAFATGLDILLMIGGTNTLYLNDDGEEYILTDEQREAYANFVLETVKHYPQIRKIELLNEPGYKYTGEEYKKIVLAAAKKVKEHNPDIEIYVGSLFDDANDSRTPEPRQAFLENMFNEEVYQYVDNVSYHTYSCLGSYYGYADCDAFTMQSKAVFEEARKEGGWKKISLTETGWPNLDKENVPPEKQASELVKRMILGDGMGLSFITLYELKCEPLLESAGQGRLGVMSGDYELYPAYFSVKKFLEKTGRSQYMGKAKLADGMQAYAYASDDDYFIIAWADNTNVNQSVNIDSNTGAEYTFDGNVRIEDMYGNSVEGNLLKTDHAPKYVHNLSAEFVAQRIADYGMDYFEDLKNMLTSAGYDDVYSQIETGFAEAANNVCVQTVEEYVNLCYDLGDRLIEEFNEGNIEITMVQISNVLSEINRAAEYGARLFACCEEYNQKPDISDTVLKYQKTTELLKGFTSEELKYKDQPYREGKYILNTLSKYEESDLIVPQKGRWYELDSYGKLTITGKSTTEMVSVKIIKDGEIIFIETPVVNSENVFSVSYQLPEMGEYELYVKTDELTTETVKYERNGYISVGDKMTYIESLRAARLLDWTRAWLSDDMILPLNVTTVTEDNKTYLQFEYGNVDGEIVVALYNRDALVAIAEVQNGVCRIDVTDMSEYEACVFIWNSMEGMVPKSTVYKRTEKI